VQPISRRVFLAGSVAVVVASCTDDAPAGSPATSSTAPADVTAPTGTDSTEATAAPPTASTQPAIELASDPFTLGVASGDATAEGVVLWTRLAPDPLRDGGMPDIDVEVTWEISGDGFDSIAASGTEIARADQAHSVHAVVERPSTDAVTWSYRFRAAGFTSPIGVTQCAPPAGAANDGVRFVSASCQNYQNGYYVAHRDIAAQLPDFVVFLGDYIYEGGQSVIGTDGNVRSHGTAECTTLSDYRNRYALYKSDPDLQAAHAACPWFVIWDDHEVENNYAGTAPQGGDDATTFAERRRDAYQAWWEHQPVALPPPPADGEFTIYRSVQWGSLLTLALLDGRQYRSDQACGGATLDLDPACPETFDETRTMLGEAQEQWLTEVLDTSTSTWNVIAQQTVFGDVTLSGAVLNYDQWDGYPVQRNRIVDGLAMSQPKNTIVLTGDIHFAGTGTIRAGGRGTGTPVGVEFVATSISSGGRIDPAVTGVVKAIPDILDVELEHRGYILHEVNLPTWHAEYRMVDTVKELDSSVFVHATYRVDAGTNMVRFADT
jgi:alkaline phosphatase D